MYGNPLYIIGYMASGKTTFGRALAKRTAMSFLDLDEEIERQLGKSVSEVMAKMGHDYFRRIEAEILHQTANLKNTVISCGGGTPCYFDNMEFMNSHGTTLWLRATPEKIAERVLQAGQTRPLLKDVAPDQLPYHIARHIEQRLPYYSKARINIDSGHLENEQEIEQTVTEFLKDYAPLPRPE